MKSKSDICFDLAYLIGCVYLTVKMYSLTFIGRG